MRKDSFLYFFSDYFLHRRINGVFFSSLILTVFLTLQLCAEGGGYEVEMEEAEEALPNIDEKDEENPMSVVEYVEDIYDFYRETA